VTVTDDSTPGYHRYPRFAENGSIRTWFTLWLWLGSPIAMLVLIITAAAAHLMPLLAPGILCGLMWALSVGVLATWGVGIRIDNTGIRIGACKRTSRWWWRAWEKIRLVSGPSITRPTTYTVFMPWDGITSVRVVTDHKDMKQLIRTAPHEVIGSKGNRGAGLYYQAGIIMPRFVLAWRHWAVRGFLVFDVDPSHAQVPEFRGYSGFLAMPPASTWMCPVRRPKRLRKALEDLEPLLSR
jgi:hypothetical protein